VGFGLLAAAGLIVLVSVVSAVISALSSPGLPSGDFHAILAIPGSSVAVTLLSATQWATIYFSLLLLAVLGIVWWQIQGWLEVLDEADDSDEELRTALDHLARARHLDNAVMVAFCILIAAAIGNVVGIFLQNMPEGVSPPLVAGYVGETGIAIATCLIAAVAIWSGVRLRSSVDEAVVGVNGIPTAKLPSE
jgi:hypothetical protein